MKASGTTEQRLFERLPDTRSANKSDKWTRAYLQMSEYVGSLGNRENSEVFLCDRRARTLTRLRT